MIKKTNYRLQVVVPRKNYDDFRARYRDCLGRFIRNALICALRNRAFFEKVFFLDFQEAKNEFV